MLKNYILIAWRHLKRAWVYTLINVLGLAVGMAATILIFLYIQFETSFDTFHKDTDRIFRVTRAWYNEDGSTSLHLGAVAPVVAPLLTADYGEDIEHITRIVQGNDILFAVNEDRQFVEETILFADPAFFDVFSFDLLVGNPQEALVGPGKVILSKSTAMRYFGSTEDALGQSMTVDNQFPVVVSGIVADAPKNSHFHYNVLVSFDSWIGLVGGPEVLEDNWGWNSYYTYIKVADGVTMDRMQSQMPDFIDRQIMAYLQRTQTAAPDTDRFPHEGTMLHWQPLTDIHLRSNLDSELEANSSINLVYGYGAIAILILAIACINFMNLSTARSSKREKEVGLRKVFGAAKPLLVRQFLTEAMVMSLLALLLAMLLVEGILPFFNEMVDRSLTIDYLGNGSYYLQLLALALLVGLLAGSYPAYFLSHFQPASILRGTFKNRGGSGVSLRSILVVTQFTAAVVLLICMGVVLEQLQFLQSKDLAFNDQGVVIVEGWGVEDHYEEILTDLERSPAIASVAYTTITPSNRLLNAQGGSYEIDGETKDLQFRLANVGVGFNFLETYGITLLAGRDFDPSRATDSTQAFVVNESAIETMGFGSPQEAIDAVLDYGGNEGRIVGVVKNFHFENAKFPITPVVFHINNNNTARVSARVSPGREEEAIAWLKERFAYYQPGYDFEATWVGDRFARQYEEEGRLGRVFGYFALLAVVIAMLGLFGLALHATQSRIREIGVRKVLGASNFQVVSLLTTRFSRLVMVAFLLGAPTAYLLMSWYLNTFPYHTSISWAVILGAGLVVLLIALLTVSSQSIKAATTNPTTSLRSE